MNEKRIEAVKQDVNQIYALLEQSLSIQSHYQLLNWLQSDIQAFIPHDILISAWGDFSLGIFYLDIVAIHPLLRTSNIDKEKLRPQINAMLELWESSNMNPVALNIEDGFFDIHGALKTSESQDSSDRVRDFNLMSSCLIHGIKDNRAHDDCLYLLLSSQSTTQSSKSTLPILLPFIDNALRRIQPLPAEAVHVEANNDALNPALTSRECEIMELVKNGYTNIEIATELDISRFTVKNHLQRIFKKLDASNRSQATFKYKMLDK